MLVHGHSRVVLTILRKAASLVSFVTALRRRCSCQCMELHCLEHLCRKGTPTYSRVLVHGHSRVVLMILRKPASLVSSGSALPQISDQACWGLDLADAWSCTALGIHAGPKTNQ